jgi:sec-independent protein translocase protein TatC
MVEDDPDSRETDDRDLTARMSFLDHLEELRARLLWALASVGVGFALAIFFASEIFGFIMRPMQRLLPAGQQLIYTDPGLILALGITFQLPTLVVFLARMGMITPRFMIKNFKFAVLLIVIAAGVLSPDGGGVGMMVMGGPVILLYVLSIGLAWAFGRKKTIGTDTHQSEQALLFLVTADWLRRKSVELLSSKAVTQALRS